MDERWIKAARSEGANNCVELGHLGGVRDSKNPGLVLLGLARQLVTAVQRGRVG